MTYANSYQIIAEGDFALTFADGTFGGQEAAYCAFFSVEGGLIVEHRDVVLVSVIPPQPEWQN